MPRSAASLNMAGILGLVLLLELIPLSGAVDRRFLPPFHEVAAAFGAELARPDFWSALGATLLAWGLGLAAAIVLGTVAGIAIGSSPALVAATGTTIEFLRPIPSVALIPLVILIYGTELPSSLVLVIYGAVWPVLIQVLAGIRDVDPVARQTARSYRIGRWRELRYLVWPSILPFLITGARLSAAIALALAITAELVIGAPGLGREIALAQSGGATAILYAYVLTTGALGVIVNMAARLVERSAIRWHIAVRTAA